jgi:hypothetical protein
MCSLLKAIAENSVNPMFLVGNLVGKTAADEAHVSGGHHPIAERISKLTDAWSTKVRGTEFATLASQCMRPVSRAASTSAIVCDRTWVFSR